MDITTANVGTLTKDLPKLREVAAWTCKCNNGSFSLSRYGLLTILDVWGTVGLKMAAPSDVLQSDAFAVVARQICELLETHLVETDSKNNPFLPPFVTDEVFDLV